MRIGPAANVARLNVAEEITALWTFSNVLGLLTDIIGERTAAAGVTIDGVLIRDGALRSELLSAATNNFWLAMVDGDASHRFNARVNGLIEWGDGTGARDTNLFRAAAGELATDDDFNVGGVLDLAGDLEITSRDIALSVGDNNDVASGTVPVQRCTPTGASLITGFAGGRADRILVVLNEATAGTVSLSHQDGNSAAANRIIGPNATGINMDQGESAILWYDGADSRWRILSKNI